MATASVPLISKSKLSETEPLQQQYSLPNPDSEESAVYTGKEFHYISRLSLYFPESDRCETAITVSVKVVSDDYTLPEGYQDMPLFSEMLEVTASGPLPVPVRNIVPS